MKKISLFIDFTKDKKFYSFKILYECYEYIFAQCENKPELNGFFTRNFINKNQNYSK